MNSAIDENTIEIRGRIHFISDFVPNDLYLKTRIKFAAETDTGFAVAMKETIKFLYLCAYAERPIFFPGDKLIDLIWHALIVETAQYRSICENIRAGCFIDHSGIKYQDYVAKQSSKSVHEEQFSWLASYSNTFKDISPDAFQRLPLAQTIAKRLEVDLPGLNQIAKELAAAAVSILPKTIMPIDELIEKRVRPKLAKIDSSKEVVGELISEIFEAARLDEFDNSKNILLKPDQLEAIMGTSPPLGFTIWQHLSAVERLSNAIDWQKNNKITWELVRSAKKLVGLATTHLATPSSISIESKLSEDGSFILDGVLPWASGRAYFDYLVVGFKHNEEIVFALADFPKRDLVSNKSEIRVEEHNLEVCNSTDSVRITIKNFVITADRVISRYKPINQIQPRPSSYINPEAGIATEILNRVLETSKNQQHPKFSLILGKEKQLRKQLQDLRLLRGTNNSDWPKQRVALEIENLIYNSIKLLLIAQGASSLQQKSETLLIQSQLALLQSWVQSSDLVKLKIESLG